MQKQRDTETNPVDPIEQKRRDKEFAEYERSLAKRPFPDWSFRDEYGQRWERPSSIFDNPELQNPVPMPIRRKRFNRTQKDSTQ
jgi:hypothetical protein